MQLTTGLHGKCNFQRSGRHIFPKFSWCFAPKYGPKSTFLMISLENFQNMKLQTRKNKMQLTRPGKCHFQRSGRHFAKIFVALRAKIWPQINFLRCYRLEISRKWDLKIENDKMQLTRPGKNHF